jgi:hypothetical protein
MLVRHAFAIVLGLGLAGCAAPYTVRQQSLPNPFAGAAPSFAVMPLDFSIAHVDEGTPGTKWEDGEKEDFERAKVAMNVAYQREVLSSLHDAGIAAAPARAANAASAAYVIRPHVLEITPGDFTGMTTGLRTRVRVGVEIASRSGEVLDVVEVEHTTADDPLAGDVEARFTANGSTVGERLAIYVHERVAPGSEPR